MVEGSAQHVKLSSLFTLACAHTQFLKKLEFRLTPKAYTSKKSIVKSLSDGIPTYSLLHLEQYLTLILPTRASGLWTLKEKVNGSNSQYPDEKGNPSKAKSSVYRPPIYRRGRMEHQYLDPPGEEASHLLFHMEPQPVLPPKG